MQKACMECYCGSAVVEQGRLEVYCALVVAGRIV